MLGEQFIKIIIYVIASIGILMLITVTYQAIGAANQPSLILSIARQGLFFFQYCNF
jgi:hypothetical protein